jgi:hypothetical protein
MLNVSGRKRVIIIFITVIFMEVFLSGCLGEHQTCHECGGVGSWESSEEIVEFGGYCDRCDGDGEIGLFINDEETEDTLSIALVIIIIMIIVFIGMFLISYYKKPITPPSQQQYSQPYLQQQYPPPPPPQQSQIRLCNSCRREIPTDSRLCPYCGLQQ